LQQSSVYDEKRWGADLTVREGKKNIVTFFSRRGYQERGKLRRTPVVPSKDLRTSEREERQAKQGGGILGANGESRDLATRRRGGRPATAQVSPLRKGEMKVRGGRLCSLKLKNQRERGRERG